jgi:hypothetical protein
MSTLRVNTIQNTSSVNLFPTGNVIQVVSNRFDPNADTYTAVAQDTRLNSDVSCSITPKFASSKLYVVTRYHVRVISALGCSFGINRDGVAVDGMVNRNSLDFFYKNDQVNHHYTGYCSTYLNANSTSTTTFTIWAQGWAGGPWERSYGHGDHNITVMEIAE